MAAYSQGIAATATNMVTGGIASFAIAPSPGRCLG
jgi:hypothetical protein